MRFVQMIFHNLSCSLSRFGQIECGDDPALCESRQQIRAFVFFQQNMQSMPSVFLVMKELRSLSPFADLWTIGWLILRICGCVRRNNIARGTRSVFCLLLFVDCVDFLVCIFARSLDSSFKRYVRRRTHSIPAVSGIQAPRDPAPSAWVC